MAESWLQKRARLQRETQKREARAKAEKALRDIAEAQRRVKAKRDKDELAKQRAKREQRRRNQGK